MVEIIDAEGEAGGTVEEEDVVRRRFPLCFCLFSVGTAVSAFGARVAVAADVVTLIGEASGVGRDDSAARWLEELERVDFAVETV